MVNFFSKLFKQKKIVFFVLFLVASGAFLPSLNNIVFAQAGAGQWAGLPNPAKTPVATTPPDSGPEAAGNATFSWGQTLMGKGLFVDISRVALLGCWKIASWLASLFSVVLAWIT